MTPARRSPVPVADAEAAVDAVGRGDGAAARRRNGSPNGSRAGRLTDVLGAAAAAVHGRLVPRPLGRNGAAAADGWVGVDELVTEPQRLDALVEASGRRLRSDDRLLVTAQIARESVSVLVAAAVHLWADQRRLPDVSAGNVLLRESGSTIEVGLRSLRLAVLPGDPLVGRSGVELVADEAGLLARLVDRVIGHPVPAGAVPPGPPDRVAAVAAVIATVRRAVRCGDRHLWGNAALAAGSALTSVSHTVGERADRDREALLGARPDLARTLELVTVDDTLGGEITFALRRTCCLLYKLPERLQCGTCSLRDRAFGVTWSADYYRQERRDRRSG